MVRLERALFAVEDGIARITLNNPAQRNCFDHALLADFGRMLDAIEADPSIRVVVITGAGDRAFSAGGNLADLPPDEEAGRAWLHAVVEPMRRLERLAPPLVAAVNGAAYGGGFGLVLLADYAIAAEHATFCLPEARFGQMPVIALIRAAEKIGRANAAALLLLGDPIDAAEAWRVGLVNRVVPAAELPAATETVARTLASRAPLALRTAKRALARTADDGDWDTVVDRLAPLYGTRDFREGLAAYREKRTPTFAGC